ncbi:MAG: hypothetical protein M3P98_04100, partial [bacterium]|nr:hypothetical protein [bacterium]
DKKPVGSGCEATKDFTNGSELLENGMRLSSFSITSGGSELWSINIKVVYGDDDLLNNPEDPETVQCKGGVTGSQWCAVSGLKTKVYKRIATP